jgi:2-epi-valiolone-7-phosphate 1-reductase
MGRREIELRVLRAGLCGTDVQIARGSRPDPAGVLGHEGLAVRTTGDCRPVLFNPVNRQNQEAVLGHSYDGLFQERVVVPHEADGGPELLNAAPGLVADLAPLVEPLGTVLYSYELLNGGRPLRSVMIVGGGIAAVLHTLIARRLGLRVHLVHRRAERLSWLLVQQLTGHAHLHPAENDLAERVRAANEGEAVDAAVLCVPRDGAYSALDTSLPCVRDGGLINLFGGFRLGDRHPRIPGVDLGAVRRANVRGVPSTGHYVEATTLTGSHVRLTGHRGTSVKHLEDAQELLLQAPEEFANVITTVVSLEKLACILRRTDLPVRKPERCKVIVDLGLDPHAERTVDLTHLVGDLG